MAKGSIFICLIFINIRLFAQLSMPAVFGDNMVLQQNCKVLVWGYGNRDEVVKIQGSWSSQDTVYAKADVLGKFQAYLSTGSYGGPYTLNIWGSRNFEYTNVMLGEVWLCSGQSNMAMPLGRVLDGNMEAMKADNPQLRIFSVPVKGAATVQNDCDGHWDICLPENAKRTSAVAYYFARQLNEKMQVPVGILVSAVGGTPAEAWTPKEVVERDTFINKNLCEELWNTRPSRPGVLYNWMIHPIITYTFAGCIWYQGESNHLHYRVYSRLLEVMLKSWREKAGKEFPFYLVQIAPFRYNSERNTPALLREQQTEFIRKVNRTGMVVISDLVDNLNDIHPILKKDVGVRLANLALGDLYDYLPDGFDAPVFSDIRFEKGKAIICFDHLKTLVKKMPEIDGLQIAGQDSIFHIAMCEVKENNLIVWSEKVKKPVFVRYCFTDSYTPGLFNEAGLPVAPFRTDNF